MATDKDKTPQRSSALAASGLNAKSIIGLNVFSHGSTLVIEVVHSAGSQFVKVRQGQVKVGGDHEWETGTVVL